MSTWVAGSCDREENLELQPVEVRILTRHSPEVKSPEPVKVIAFDGCLCEAEVEVASANPFIKISPGKGWLIAMLYQPSEEVAKHLEITDHSGGFPARESISYIEPD